MPKYKIAWLPGDGVGGEVLQAARIVLDRLGTGCGVSPGRHWLGVLAPGKETLCPAAP